MKALIVFILALIIYATFTAYPVQAISRGELIATARHVKAKDERAERERLRAVRIQRVRGYLASKGSPLAGDAQSFVDCADRFGLHPGLLVGITRAESTFGRFYTLKSNPYNFGIYLKLSFPDMVTSTCYVAQKLRENYNTTSPYTIAVKYAPAADRNNPVHWAQVVQQTIDELSI